MQAPNDLADAVQPARVHRKLYTDPGIFDLEMERIFGHAWLYVGHESQVRNPGDYFLTQVGRKAMVVTRDETGRYTPTSLVDSVPALAASTTAMAPAVAMLPTAAVTPMAATAVLRTPVPTFRSSPTPIR